MDNNSILQVNESYWNATADDWFGVTALPEYGVQFVTENDATIKSVLFYDNLEE